MSKRDDAIDAAKEAFRKPGKMMPNTSEGSLGIRLEAAVDAYIDAMAQGDGLAYAIGSVYSDFPARCDRSGAAMAVKYLKGDES